MKVKHESSKFFSDHAFHDRLKERCPVSRFYIPYLLNNGRYVPIKREPGSTKVFKLIYVWQIDGFVVVVQDESNGEIITILNIHDKRGTNGSVGRVLSNSMFQRARRLSKAKSVLNLSKLEEISKLNVAQNLKLEVSAYVWHCRKGYSARKRKYVPLRDLTNFNNLEEDPVVRQAVYEIMQNKPSYYCVEFVMVTIKDFSISPTAINWFDPKMENLASSAS